MKIGIGITTRNRSVLLKYALSKFKVHFPDCETIVIVSDDSDDDAHKSANEQIVNSFGFKYLGNNNKRLGIAKNKNKCLFELKDCDYIFLFDDDCFPFKDDWYKFVIGAHLATGIHHFNILDVNFHNVLQRRNVGEYCIIECALSGGVMLFLTNEVIKRVGAFNKLYDIYGYEHCSYSNRIYRSGLQNGYGANVTIDKIQDYLFSVDYAQFEVNQNNKLFQTVIQEIGDLSFVQTSMKKDDVRSCIMNNSSIYISDSNGPIFQEF